jgi:hypothetical protein
MNILRVRMSKRIWLYPVSSCENCPHAKDYYGLDYCFAGEDISRELIEDNSKGLTESCPIYKNSVEV